MNKVVAPIAKVIPFISGLLSMAYDFGNRMPNKIEMAFPCCNQIEILPKN